MITKSCSVPGCKSPYFVKGYCSGHYHRARKYGDPLSGGTAPGAAMEYFRSVVIPYRGDDCLVWPFSTNKAGYGKLNVGRRVLKHVHWLACTEVHGPQPTVEHEAAHNCGNGHKGCCNPRHVEWKTRAQNQADRISHKTDCRGERSPNGKLKEHQVRQIRAMRQHATVAEMSRIFGVSRGCIGGILSGKNWSWLDAHHQSAPG